MSFYATIDFDFVQSNTLINTLIPRRISARPCPDLKIPENGAVACNGWMKEFTRLCIVFCRIGTRLSDRHDFRTKYVCGGSGKWLPTEELPACKKTKANTTSGMICSYNYFLVSMLFNVIPEEIVLIMRRAWDAKSSTGQCSAHRAFVQGGVFIVPHL